MRSTKQHFPTEQPSYKQSILRGEKFSPLKIPLLSKVSIVEVCMSIQGKRGTNVVVGCSPCLLTEEEIMGSDPHLGLHDRWLSRFQG